MVKNIFSLASAEVATKALAFLLVITIARYLQDTEFGKYSFVFAFTSFFAIISDLGLSTLTIRDVARNKELTGKYLGNISIFKLILSIIGFVILVIIINSLNYSSDVILATYIIGAYVIIDSFNRFLMSFFRAFEKMQYETLVRVIEKSMIFLLAIYMIHQKEGLIEIVIVFLISGILNFILIWAIVIKKFSKPQFRIDFSFLKNLFLEALPFGLNSIFVIIYFRIDVVMLSIMTEDSVVGWYNAAYNIVDGLCALFITTIVGVSYPLMSRYYIESMDALKRLFLQLFQILLILGLLISISMTVLAPKMIPILYGDSYINSIKVFQILIWSFFIICVSMISSTVLYSINKQKLVTIGTGLGALSNITLNYILIPKYSLYGAAYATLITEFLGFIIYFYYSMKILRVDLKDFLLITTITKYIKDKKLRKGVD